MIGFSKVLFPSLLPIEPEPGLTSPGESSSGLVLILEDGSPSEITGGELLLLSAILFGGIKFFGFDGSSVCSSVGSTGLFSSLFGLEGSGSISGGTTGDSTGGCMVGSNNVV